MTSEEWRPIRAWPLYEVSDHGRVRRAASGKSTSPGRVRRLQLTKGKKSAGYVSVMLHNGRRGAVGNVNVGRAVLEAFVGPPPSDRHECNHKNGIKTDNRPENLEWVSPSENIRHAFATGLKVGPRGEQQGAAKLSEAQVREIRARYRSGGITQTTLAGQYGISQAHLSDIVSGRRGIWAHVSDTTPSSHEGCETVEAGRG